MQSLPQVAPDQFEVISLLGSGGMSSVYLARQKDMDRMVAIKILHRHLTFDAKSLQRFKNEAAWTGRVDHPNVVSIYSFGISDDQPYLVMEYVQGRTLKAIIACEGVLKPDRVRAIAMQVLEGLQHAHDQGIVHRDLKPENIMIVELEDGSEQVKILDFGVAKVIEECRTQAQKLTGTGALIGSPLYMSPEQLKGQPADVRSDIYSVSCILFEALVGRPPFKTDNMLELMQSHMSSPVPSFSSILQEHSIPGTMELAVRKGLEKNPNSRHSSASSFAQSLARGKFGKPLRAMVSINSAGKLGLACLCVVLGGLVFFYTTKTPEKTIVRSHNDTELQHFIDDQAVWQKTIERIKPDEKKAEFLDECVRYAREAKVNPADPEGPEKKALTLAQALQNRAMVRLGWYRVLAGAHPQHLRSPEIREELNRYNAQAKRDAAEAIKVLKDAKVGPTNKHHLHELPNTLAEALEHEGLLDQAREVRQESFVVYPLVGCLDRDYFWLYLDANKNACLRQDRKEEYEFALKAMDRLPGVVGIDYANYSLGFPTLVEYSAVALMRGKAANCDKAIAQIGSRLKTLRAEAFRPDWLKAIDSELQELKGPVFRTKILDHAGRDAFRSRQWPAAEEFYLAAIPYFEKSNDKTPLSIQHQTESWYHLGFALGWQNKTKQAEKAMEKTIMLAPRGTHGQSMYTHAYCWLADQQYGAGHSDEAIKLIEKGLAGSSAFAKPSMVQHARVSLQGQKGNYLRMSGRFKELVDDLSAFQKSIPEEYPHHKHCIQVQLVNGYIALGDFPEADKQMLKAQEISSKLDKDPHATDAVIQVLQVCDQLAGVGRNQKAADLALWARDFARQRHLTPAEFFTLSGAAKYVQPIDGKKAIALAREAYELGELEKDSIKSGPLPANAYLVLGSCFNTSDPVLAEACFKRGIAARDLSGFQCDFHVANNHVMLGDLYSRQNKKDLAEQNLLRGLELHQRNYRLERNASWALATLAAHYERNKEPAKAIQLKEELLHALETPEIPRDQRDFAYTTCADLARLYEAQGKTAEAKQYKNRSLKYQH